MSEIQWFVFSIVVLSVIFEVRWIFRNKAHFLYSLPWLFLFTHSLIFYTSLIISPGVEVNIDDKFYAVWSSILRAHSYLTIFGFILYRKNQRR